MRRAVRHDDVAAKFARVALGHKDAAIMRDAAGKRALINLPRGPVVITVLIFALEGIEATKKMNRAGRSVGPQFDETGDRRGGRGVDRSPSIRPAAPDKNKREPDQESSCYNARRFGHKGQFSARIPSVNGKLRSGKTPTMLQAP
jgi:hypothetical protein